MGALVYAGAQFGTIISMPISGLLAETSWPSIFYVFGFIGVVWSLAFLWTVYEEPSAAPRISTEEKNYINKAIWGTGSPDKSPAIPWRSIVTSMPFYAILFAHVSANVTMTHKVFTIHFDFQMAQNYGYEFLMTELPTYMRQILRFSIKEVIIRQLLSDHPINGLRTFRTAFSRLFPISECGSRQFSFQ